MELLILWRKAGWKPRARWSRACFRDLWRFSASRGLANVLSYIDKHVPRLILGRVAGAAELGQFVFARNLIDSAANTMFRPVKDVTMPVFAQVQNNADEARRLYRSGSRLTADFVFPTFAGLALIAPMMVPLVLGKRWIGVIPFIQLFALTAYRRSFNVWNSALLRGLGRPDLLLIGSTWRTMGTIALIIWLLPHGALGVCVAVIIGSFINWPIGMRYAARLTGLGYGVQIREEAPALGATLAMVGILLVVQSPVRAYLSPWTAPVVFAAAGAVVYLAALALIARKDLIALYQLLRKIAVIFSRGGSLKAREEDEDSVAEVAE